MISGLSSFGKLRRSAKRHCGRNAPLAIVAAVVTSLSCVGILSGPAWLPDPPGALRPGLWRAAGRAHEFAVVLVTSRIAGIPDNSRTRAASGADEAELLVNAQAQAASSRDWAGPPGNSRTQAPSGRDAAGPPENAPTWEASRRDHAGPQGNSQARAPSGRDEGGPPDNPQTRAALGRGDEDKFRADQNRPAINSATEIFTFLDEKQEEFVYSAHYDDMARVVQIVGFKHRFSASATRQLWCRFRSENGYTPLEPLSVYFNVSTLYPRQGLLYNTFIWKCSTSGGVIPKVIELTVDPSSAPRVALSVTYVPRERERHEFGICVKPMVNYNNINQLIEFIEVHRLFGVAMFVIYDYTHSLATDDVLRFYVSKGVVKVHAWPLPVPLDAVHAFGQKSTNHHCLMTYRNVFKYIAFIDLDEILVPLPPARSWSDIVLAAQKSPGSQASDGAFVFMSSLFPRAMRDYTDLNCSCPLLPCEMATLVNRARFTFYTVGTWSKPLVETWKTDIVDIHVVRRMMDGHTTLDVSTDVAFLHHYREVDVSEKWVRDNGTQPFKSDIMKAVGEVLEKFSPNRQQSNSSHI